MDAIASHLFLASSPRHVRRVARERDGRVDDDQAAIF